MFEIKGTIATAICYATVVEEEAIQQIQRMCDQEFTRNSRIRIMPDMHAGKGCTIGTTMTVTDKAVPNVVGVDIGCGMYAVAVGRDPINLARLDEAVHYVPSWMSVWEGKRERFDLQSLRCYRALRDTKRLERSLGTLDKAPMAYKSLTDIAGVIGDTVEIIDILKPIYNFKASEEVVGKRLR